jgi:eukaryotic-like serine/threonine-protein kinase
LVSNVREALVAALNDWAISSPEPSSRSWLLEVARLADRDPTGWSGRAFDPATWADKATLAEVIKSAPIAEQSIPLLVVLAQLLEVSGEDPVPFMKRIQQAQPGDFWANLLLGNGLTRKDNSRDAIGYYQAALAVRPGTAVVHNNLAMVMASTGRLEDAVDQYRRALKIDPNSAAFHHNLALVL